VCECVRRAGVTQCARSVFTKLVEATGKNSVRASHSRHSRCLTVRVQARHLKQLASARRAISGRVTEAELTSKQSKSDDKADKKHGKKKHHKKAEASPESKKEVGVALVFVAISKCVLASERTRAAATGVAVAAGEATEHAHVAGRRGRRHRRQC
jgi:hypothetical protein